MRKFILLAGMVTMASPVFALDEEIAGHPNADLVSFYEANFPDIEKLRAAITEGESTESRVEAFVELSISYPLAAEISARSLVSHENTELAIQAVRFLKLNTVMSDHDMSVGMDQLSPEVGYAMTQHMASRAALRAGVSDSRPELRSETAAFLSSLSDAEALQSIQELTGELYTDVEAANLFTLASGETGEAFISQYLGSGSVQAQQTAVSYLGAIPSYQDDIRSAYFLNPEAPIETRTAAAMTLGTYDARFAEYALAATSDGDGSPALIGATIDGYLSALTASGGAIDPAIARALSDMVPNDSQSLPALEREQLEGLQDRLNAIISNGQVQFE